MKIVVCIIFTCGFVSCYLDFKEQHNSDVGMQRMVRLMMDYAHKAKVAIDEVNPLRAEHEVSPHFELGYVMSELLDKYRKMVETARHPLDFNSDTVIDTLRATELVQRLFFEIYHLVNIIHEIPKKYGRMPEFSGHGGYDPTKIAETEKRIARLERERRRRKRKWLKEMLNMQALGQLAQIAHRKPVRPGNKWWPIDYGWEIDYYW
ncbi:uncharacterized protein LOC121736461 isoform X1 [Aricia agestis]|uniref:uncharacterized protein LOC121736461 isoform X1 n=1 Tax=Aricia agestis TaxID=91739 RepID=UPI001C201614|nr:uncharacterized protein LOC121736461 isoform X1 [Aricia agestis]